MRHAVVVAPPGFVLPSQGSVFATPEPVGPLCATLSRAGYHIVVLPSSADLEASFERSLAGVGPSDELLVCVNGTIAGAGDDVALRVDTPAADVPLRALADAVAARAPSAALFLVEACHEGSDDDPMAAAEHVDAITRSLDARRRGTAALIGVRPASRAHAGSWPFVRSVLYAAQDPEARDAGGVTSAARTVERLRAGRVDDGQVQSFVFVPGHADFPLLPSGEAALGPPSARGSVPPGGVSPPVPVVTTRSSAPPGSLPPPSMPALDPLLDLAEGARARGAWEEALAGYKAALMVAPQSDFETRASLYAHVGDVKRAQGKTREAESNFEKALQADPGQRRALDALVELAQEAGEPRRAIDWRRKRLLALETPAEMIAELLAIASLHTTALSDARGAAEALEEAHAIAPSDRAVTQALRESYEKMHKWTRVVELLAEQAGHTEVADERAELRFAAADVALGRLRDEERGLELLVRALEDEPRHDRALHALVAVRTARAEWPALDADYARLLDRFAKLGDVERAWDTCRKLGVLRRDRTRDVAGAVEAFTGAAQCKPGDVDARAMLADMHLARGDGDAAVAEFERVAELAPTRASTYARLFALHQRAGRKDAAWLVATALEELGAADVDQQLVVDQYRTEGPIRPARALDDAAWDELLRAPGADDVVAAVLRSVVDAAAQAKTEELRDARKLVALDPARRQSATSTVSVVRSFQWAAQVLGVDPPALYVMDAVPGGIAAVQAGEPSTALGPDVLRGLGTKDLAFLAGRHLTYFRREHYALVCYPTLPEISTLFLAALKVAMPEIPVPTAMAEAVGRLRKTLAKHASDGDRKALGRAVERLEARDGRVDLGAWVRSVELSAQRAGLLLAGDLRAAMTRLRGETRSIAELAYEQRRGDLLGYVASGRCARARVLLGVGSPTSLYPPPPSSRAAL